MTDPPADLSSTFKNLLPRVHLVGAGPGDPGLLTQKGAQLLSTADVILYDHLVPLELLDLASPAALLIDVGKIRNHPVMTQQEIEATMIDHARQGRIVVRLKGGDPFMFGRGGEEAQALQKAGIPFAVVPGISSPIAVPAYAGVPVTHRDFNSRLVILTGHDNPSVWSDNDLASLALPNQTIVVLMGVMYMKQFAKRLVHAGLPKETPALIVRWGTTARQESFETPLGDLENFLEENPVSPPAILLIGEVVRVRSEIGWVHRLPLFGKRILLTRERERSEELGRMFETLGASVVSCPTVSIIPALSENFDTALSHLKEYAWLVFLSPNGVRHFFRELSRRHWDLRVLAGLRIFSMGSSTTEALSSVGILPDASPESSHGAGVVNAFAAFSLPDRSKILLVRGDRGSGVIPEGLKKLGHDVDTIGVYENILPEIPPYKRERLNTFIEDHSIDLAIYYSPSAFTGLCELFPELLPRIMSIPSLAIGPTTKAALEKGPASTILLSRLPTNSGILEAALDFLSPMGNNSGGFGRSNTTASSSEESTFNNEEQVSP